MEGGWGGGVGVFRVVIENLAPFLYSAFLRDRFAREAKLLFGLYKGSEGGGGGSDGALAQNPQAPVLPTDTFLVLKYVTPPI
jgi:hypothetical protein